ncbi:NADH:quinone reductase [Acrasis kona]|uniref:NADH:ubiquinone reductase (non-electrogenic) n=1 Tax=Acrasis kona TaxID=1008807 RepID=A0AAW2YJ45_9EUKA
MLSVRSLIRSGRVLKNVRGLVATSTRLNSTVVEPVVVEPVTVTPVAPVTPGTPNPQPRGKRRLLWVFSALVGGAIVYYLVKEDDDVYVDGKQTGYPKKPRVVILGSGWAALSMVRDIDPNLYEVVVVSPRNYFLFTPLLPSVTVGTLDSKSVMEPIRKYCKRTNTPTQYYEAMATDVDFDAQKVICKDVNHLNNNEVTTFELPYDHLVVSVGAINNTFGTPGVYENCFFLKEMEDATLIRRRILDVFETANLPAQTEAERRRLLSFVVVGGGPNGVEFAAELSDFLREDLKKWYPHLIKDVKVTILELMDHILNTYDRQINSEKVFKRENIDIRTNHQVTAVSPDGIVVRPVIKGATTPQPTQTIPFGLCVWSTGIGIHPLSNLIREKLKPNEIQTNRRALITDQYLSLKGAKNVYALGDCATITPELMIKRLEDLFKEADANGDNKLQLDEFRRFVNLQLPNYPQLEEYGKRAEELFLEADADKAGSITLDQFRTIVQKVDSKMKILPATAQVASQQGAYLAKRLNALSENKDAAYPPFKYRHLGSFAYIGADEAVAELTNPWIEKYVLQGYGAWWLWRSVYLSKQFSMKNKLLVGGDWVKTELFGRDITRN